MSGKVLKVLLYVALVNENILCSYYFEYAGFWNFKKEIPCGCHEYGECLGMEGEVVVDAGNCACRSGFEGDGRTTCEVTIIRFDFMTCFKTIHSIFSF